jgi:crotonobetaine/carnitine-CoA ligase
VRKQDLHDLGGGSSSGLLASRAALIPDKVALMFKDEQYTYRELDDAATSIAAGLMALGLVKGDAVAVFLKNRAEYVTVGQGVSRAGLVGVPVNSSFKAGFLEYPIERTNAKVLVTEGSLNDAVLSMDTMPASVETIIYVDEKPANPPTGVANVLSLAELTGRGDPDQQLPELFPHDVNSILFTSGTTGRSKGVVCPNLMGVMMAKEHAQVFDVTPRDRMFTAFPMYHGMAQVATVLTAFYAGATAILSPGFSMTTFWDEIRASGATQFNALGAVLHLLLMAPESAGDQDHQVTRVFSAPAPPDALYRFETRFGVHLIEGYGQTEIKNVMYNPWHARKIGSMGVPTPSSIVEIHDENGNALPAGDVGEIVYRPTQPHVMNIGYLDDPEATLAASKGLWWHTGDVGWRDDDGYFHFFDRKTDSLRRRGENISSTELEEILATFPGIQVAAAVRAESDLGENEVLAVVSVADPDALDLTALWQHCVDHMPRFMVPRYFRVMAEVPMTPTGKIRKVDLRDAGITDAWDSVAAGLTVPK